MAWWKWHELLPIHHKKAVVQWKVRTVRKVPNLMNRVQMKFGNVGKYHWSISPSTLSAILTCSLCTVYISFSLHFLHFLRFCQFLRWLGFCLQQQLFPLSHSLQFSLGTLWLSMYCFVTHLLHFQLGFSLLYLHLQLFPIPCRAGLLFHHCWNEPVQGIFHIILVFFSLFQAVCKLCQLANLLIDLRNDPRFCSQEIFRGPTLYNFTKLDALQ